MRQRVARAVSDAICAIPAVKADISGSKSGACKVSSALQSSTTKGKLEDLVASCLEFWNRLTCLWMLQIKANKKLHMRQMQAKTSCDALGFCYQRMTSESKSAVRDALRSAAKRGEGQLSKRRSEVWNEDLIGFATLQCLADHADIWNSFEAHSKQRSCSQSWQKATQNWRSRTSLISLTDMAQALAMAPDCLPSLVRKPPAAKAWKVDFQRIKLRTQTLISCSPFESFWSQDASQP